MSVPEIRLGPFRRILKLRRNFITVASDDTVTQPQSQWEYQNDIPETFDVTDQPTLSSGNLDWEGRLTWFGPSGRLVGPPVSASRNIYQGGDVYCVLPTTSSLVIGACERDIGGTWYVIALGNKSPGLGWRLYYRLAGRSTTDTVGPGADEWTVIDEWDRNDFFNYGFMNPCLFNANGDEAGGVLAGESTEPFPDDIWKTHRMQLTVPNLTTASLTVAETAAGVVGNSVINTTGTWPNNYTRDGTGNYTGNIIIGVDWDGNTRLDVTLDGAPGVATVSGGQNQNVPANPADSTGNKVDTYSDTGAGYRINLGGSLVADIGNSGSLNETVFARATAAVGGPQTADVDWGYNFFEFNDTAWSVLYVDPRPPGLVIWNDRVAHFNGGGSFTNVPYTNPSSFTIGRIDAIPVGLLGTFNVDTYERLFYNDGSGQTLISQNLIQTNTFDYEAFWDSVLNFTGTKVNPGVVDFTPAVASWGGAFAARDVAGNRFFSVPHNDGSGASTFALYNSSTTFNPVVLAGLTGPNPRFDNIRPI